MDQMIPKNTRKHPKVPKNGSVCEINEDRPDAPRREEQSPSQSFQLGSLPLETHSDVFYGSYVNVHSDVFFGGARSCVNLKNNATQRTA